MEYFEEENEVVEDIDGAPGLTGMINGIPVQQVVPHAI